MKPKSQYTIVYKECSDDVLVIRDVGPWDTYKTITNNADNVVAELYAWEILGNRRLFYYDTSGALDELIHEQGVFTGFRFGGQQCQKQS